MPFFPFKRPTPIRLDELVRDEVTTLRTGLQTVRSGQRTALALQVQFYRRMDTVLDAVRDPPGQTLACKSGCSYCCHYHVYITADEALAISDHVHSIPTARKADVLARLRANAAQASALGPEGQMRTNIPCAFLSEDSRCSIYALRPAACRRHHSYDVTPCRVTFVEPHRDDPHPISPQRMAVSEGFISARMWATRAEGFDGCRYEMNGVVLGALTDAAALGRWMRGETSFPSVSDRESAPG